MRSVESIHHLTAKDALFHFKCALLQQVCLSQNSYEFTIETVQEHPALKKIKAFALHKLQRD